METSNKGLELAQLLGDFVNTYSLRDKGKEFIDGFCRQHRTLQQSSFRLILELIEHMASDDYKTDGRNEESKKIAKQLLAGFKTQNSIAASYSDEFSLPSKFLPFV